MMITLPILEQEKAKRIAREWMQWHAKKPPKEDTKISDKDQLKLDEDAIGAELAYCAYFNLFPLCQIVGKLYRWDAVHPDGTTVNVKSTDNPKGNLVVERTEKGQDEKPDIFALMIGKLPTYEYCGYIERKTIICKKWFNDEELKRQPGYLYPREDLKI